MTVSLHHRDQLFVERTAAPADAVLPLLNFAAARVLVVAPHPDDESLGAGALLARAASSGAQVRVLFLTDGDNNPWPQRVARRRWHIGSADHARWGRLRRFEARRALQALGVDPGAAMFFGLPDDRLASLHREHLAGLLADEINHAQPTLLVIPSMHDFHPDHRAAFRTVVHAIATHRCVRIPLVLSYIVHGTERAHAVEFERTADESARKRAAIACHRSQLVLSRGRFFRYAQRPERYAVVDDFVVRDETSAQRWLAKARHIVSLFY